MSHEKDGAWHYIFLSVHFPALTSLTSSPIYLYLCHICRYQILVLLLVFGAVTMEDMFPVEDNINHINCILKKIVIVNMYLKYRII